MQQKPLIPTPRCVSSTQQQVDQLFMQFGRAAESTAWLPGCHGVTHPISAGRLSEPAAHSTVAMTFTLTTTGGWQRWGTMEVMASPWSYLVLGMFLLMYLNNNYFCLM